MAPTGHWNGADPAFDAALPVPLQPLELAQARRQGEGSAERAEVAAEGALDEQPHAEEQERPCHEPGLAPEAQDDRGLERLDLGKLVGEPGRAQRDREQGEEDQELQAAQALVQPPGQRQLRDAQSPRALVQEFLQRAERAQPSAERPASPQDQGGGDPRPEDEDQGLEQKGLPAEAAAQGIGEGEHVDDRELGRRVPAEPDQGEGEKAQAHAQQELRPGREPILAEEDRGQDEEGGEQHADVGPARAPYALPQGGRRLGRHQVARRDGIRDLRDGRDLGAVRRAPGDQQLQAPRPVGAKAAAGRHGEQGGLAQLGRAHGRKLVDAHMAIGGETPGAVVLDELDAVEGSLAPPGRAAERVEAAPAHEQEEVARPRSAGDLGEPAAAQEIAADARSRSQTDEELGEGGVGCRRHRRHGAHAREQVGRLGTGDAPRRQGAVRPELVPGRGREAI